MAFPTTGILDSCVRSNEDPLSNGGFWSSPIWLTDDAYRIVSNQAVPQASGTWHEFYAGSYGPDAEFYITCPGLEGSQYNAMVVRGQEPNNSFDGYQGQWAPSVGSDRWLIQRVDDEVETQLGATITKSGMVAGGKMGVSAVGTTISLWLYASGSWEGTAFATRTDSTYTGAGFVGMWGRGSGWALTDIGGGTVVTAGGGGPLYGSGTLTMGPLNSGRLSA